MSSFRKSYTVHRKAPGQFVKGRWQEGQESTFTIMASIQPLKPNEMEALPEGRRTGAAVKIYTDTLLLTAREAKDDDPPQSPDVIDYVDAQYEVVAVEPRQAGVINHYKFFAVGVGE